MTRFRQLTQRNFIQDIVNEQSIKKMNKNDPVAFLSYVRSDDDHDGGRITDLRQRLEGEVRMQTGLPFHIFQDRNDILWGQQWKERLEEALMSVTFLIPIVTPSFFRSNACRDEFRTFISREKMLGENQLILPIYYVKAPLLEGEPLETDEIAKTIKARNWADWREYRFDSLLDARLRSAVASLASDIVNATERLTAVLDAAQNVTTPSEKRHKVKAKRGPAEPKRPAKEVGSTEQLLPKVVAATESALPLQSPLYHAYTKEFDEILDAGDLLDKTKVLQLHSRLLTCVRRETSAAAHDALASFSDAMRRAGKDGDFCVTLLLDNSGSLRGEPIEKIAAWASVISRILTEEEIPNEVLGFTTRAWKGGQSRELWLESGRPAAPGRLNDLRHVVYKRFDQTFQEADINFSIMLQDGLLKENIDGEAISWASDRITQRPEKRKIIISLSDGAPVDDSTLSVNPENYLTDHLIETVKELRASDDIEIYGAGLNHDVSQYYGDSPIISL